jgi:hypothetical protein
VFMKYTLALGSAEGAVVGGLVALGHGTSGMSISRSVWAAEKRRGGMIEGLRGGSDSTAEDPSQFEVVAIKSTSAPPYPEVSRPVPS